MTFLIDIQDESITDDVLESIVKMCQYMHSSVIEASDHYLKVSDTSKLFVCVLDITSNFCEILFFRR